MLALKHNHKTELTEDTEKNPLNDSINMNPTIMCKSNKQEKFKNGNGKLDIHMQKIVTTSLLLPKYKTSPRG